MSEKGLWVVCRAEVQRGEEKAKDDEYDSNMGCWNLELVYVSNHKQKKTKKEEEEAEVNESRKKEE